jgi:hypothetical protein
MEITSQMSETLGEEIKFGDESVGSARGLAWSPFWTFGKQIVDSKHYAFRCGIPEENVFCR